MASGNGKQPYTVSIPSEVQRLLETWAESAEQLGIRSEYIADLKVLNTNLLFHPKTWGDPLRDLDHARLTWYRGLSRFVKAEYAVHWDRRIVFVKSMMLRPDGPLGRSGLS
jgi:hypothetical protein